MHFITRETRIHVVYNGTEYEIEVRLSGDNGEGLKRLDQKIRDALANLADEELD